MLAEYQSNQVVVSPSRKSAERLETYLKSFPQVEVKTEHRFIPGLYVRELTIPKGVIATGAACRMDHLSVMSRGWMHVLADGVMKEVIGYAQWIAPAGVKRVGLAVDETTWFTVHPNPDEERDIEVLEARLFEQADELLHRRLADGRAIRDTTTEALQ